jgi:putative peptidoglycan lipid II flippase
VVSGVTERLHGTARRVAGAALLITGLTLASRVLGLGREVVIAHAFGASAPVDAYLVAFFLPNALQTVFGMALITVAIPLFAGYRARDAVDEAWRFFTTVQTLVVIFTGLVVVVGLVEAPQLVRLIAPGMAPATQALAVQMSYVLLPSSVFLALACLYTGLLNANHIFGVPAANGVIQNTTIIVTVLALAGPWGIHALAAGMALSAVLIAGVEGAVVRKVGLSFRPRLDVGHPGVREMARLVWPVMLGASVGQIYLLIDRFLASGLAAGSIAALNYAQKVAFLGQGLFAYALSTAVFPTLSDRAAGAGAAALARPLGRVLRFALVLGVPSALGLVVLSRPVVELLFLRGAFDLRAAEVTAGALACFAPALIGYSVNPLLTQSFYALKDTRTPVLLATASIGVKLAASLLLMPRLEAAGLALADTIASGFLGLGLVLVLLRRIPGLAGELPAGFFLRVGLGATAVCAAVLTAERFAAGLPGGFWWLAGRVGGEVALGALVYLAACLLLRLEDLGYYWRVGVDLVRRRAS